jgi:hypothetical protein
VEMGQFRQSQARGCPVKVISELSAGPQLAEVLQLQSANQ